MSPRSSTQGQEDYKTTVAEAVLNDQTFVRVTLSGQMSRQAPPWVKISIRPVLIRSRRHWQFSYFDATRNVVANFTRSRLRRPLDDAIDMPFAHIEVQSTGGDLHIRRTRKGKVLMTRGKPQPRPVAVDLTHDRSKDYLLPPAEHGAFLRAIGIADSRGQVRPTMQGKFAQVNEFLRIVDQTLADRPADGPMFIVDCGCGNAHLTFVAYHFLRNVRDRDVRVAGTQNTVFCSAAPVPGSLPGPRTRRRDCLVLWNNTHRHASGRLCARPLMAGSGTWPSCGSSRSVFPGPVTAGALT